ncbi:hypothetical protein BJ165DRAFT_762324 [Panaeolus papilionaceus]|nr:hypothetical protein BJ165DRAFT_762324 [Panaeolus papilionaceus]
MPVQKFQQPEIAATAASMVWLRALVWGPRVNSKSSISRAGELHIGRDGEYVEEYGLRTEGR